MSEPTRLTDAGNSKRLSDRIRGKMLYCAAMGKWLHDNGKFLEGDTNGQIVRYAKQSSADMFLELVNAPEVDRPILLKHAIYSESVRGINAAIKLAECELGISADALDADDFAFPVQNGIFDLHAFKLRPRTPADLNTRVSPVVFDPAALCPTWQKFLLRIMNGNNDLIRYLQRLCGLCLTGVNTVQELFILFGNGANGKSVFCDTISYIMADYAGIAPDSLLIVRRGGAEHPTEIFFTMGKRLLITSETEAGGQLRLQLIKKLTGDEKLTARPMRCDYITFVRKFKLLLVTNHKPIISESSEAAWRRVRLIPFTVTIPAEERDPNLLAKLKAEAPGILNWMIAGCIDWHKNGMKPPAEVLAATDEYKNEADPLGDFFDTRCILGDFARVSRNEIWAAYQAWLKDIGEREGMNRTAFYERVRHVDCVIDDQWKTDGVPIRGFVGIGLIAVMQPTYAEELP